MNPLPIPTNIVDDLQAVDARIIERVRSRAALIAAASSHILTSGGKRIRAAMTLLCAQLGQYQLAQVIHAAAAVEMIHAATLVHDDLIDDAERRRGKVTVHTRWDSGVALMVGDYLFALAAVEMSLAPDPRIIAFFSQAVMTICEGELSPVMVVAPLEQALVEYRYKTGCKTAALFEAGCKAGMAAGGGTAEQIERAGRFGYGVGMAFQIVDDVLDYTGDEQTLGKPAGGDLRQGTITLPLIYAAANPGGAHLAAVADAEHLSASQVDEVLAEVRRLRGAEQALAEAERYGREATTELRAFAPSQARAALEAIVRFALDRRG
jgi:heptaprenyl diphosphate synthase/octaprenyl-diphosphate synthase